MSANLCKNWTGKSYESVKSKSIGTKRRDFYSVKGVQRLESDQEIRGEGVEVACRQEGLETSLDPTREI